MYKKSLLLMVLGLLFVAVGTQAATERLGKSLTLEEALTKDQVALVFQKDASSAQQVIYYDPANETTHFGLGQAASVLNNSALQYKFKIAGDMTYDGATAYSVQFADDGKYFTVEWFGENKADTKDNRPFTITPADGTTNGYNFRCYRTDDINQETGAANDRAITFNGNGGTDAWWVAGIIYMYEITTDGEGGGDEPTGISLGSSLSLDDAVAKDNVALVFRKDASAADQIIYYDPDNEFNTTDGLSHFALGDAATVLANDKLQYRFKVAADMTYDGATAYSIQFADDNKYFTVEWNGENKADAKDNRPFVITPVDGTTNGYNFRCYRTDDNNADRAITFAGNGGTDAWWVAGIIYMYEIKSGSSVPTSISSVQSARTQDDAIYSINGMRVSKPAKGIYIKNGKKFVVK